MRCKLCNGPLIVSSGRYHSPEGSTDVFFTRKFVCVNPKCELYAGKDLNNPKVIAEETTEKMN